MSASGTSAADILHQAWDAAANLAGYSGTEPTDPNRTADNQEEKKDDDKGSDGEEYHPAPGNHPSDPRANVNHPSSVGNEKEQAQSQSKTDSEEEEETGVHSSSKHVGSGRSKPSAVPGTQDDMGQSVIDRALGDEGLTAERKGIRYDRALEDQLDGEFKASEKQGKPEAAAAELGQPIHSQRNQEDKKKKSSEQGPGAHQEHAANRGPSWASRPDDAQRAKILKMKEEQANGTWKKRLSSYGPGKSDDAAPRKSQEGKGSHKLGGLFQGAGTSSRPGPNNLDSASSNRVRRSESVNENADQQKASNAEKGKQPEKPPMAQRSSSRWAENSNKLRNAFEPPTPSAGEDKELQEQENEGVATPDLSPEDQRLRAVTKIMLKGSDGKDKGDGSTPTSPGGAQTRWAQLKKKVQESQKSKQKEKKASAAGLDLAKELQTGVLPVFLLKMAIERDESKHRRIPVLLNHLRLRVTDSVNPMHNTHAVFRIELEYGDGLVKWVIYRELRDFINLHAHYRAAALRGYLGRSIGNTEGDVGLPSFPKMSLPYFNQLQRQGKTSRAEFAKAQRDALENYIIELIRRTMFRAEANRLCKFFEISALSVSLASRGGKQGKQGYLRILSRVSRKKDQKSVLMPARWAKAYEPKWFIVRESFIAIVDEPDSLQVYDVFLMDNEFTIERPKRLYKQTMHLAHKVTNSDDTQDFNESSEQTDEKNGTQDQTALLTDGHFKDAEADKRKTADDTDRHASSHTFYIRNAERKMKLVARNERLMEQFIVSVQKMASHNIFGGTNRFESFAPIRLNASAQWLVDGRDYYWNLSKALLMAKDRVFIHDWWLSPELYLRRPGHPKWRLDNILKKKAEEGVKIFVIIYNEVSNNFTPTDSNYTKQRLIGLHRNIFVQRSPSHFQTGTFYWAHHEKLCVIDETIAFMGGLDLCFGRYDTPAHVLVDDALFHKRDGETDRDHGITHDNSFLGPTKDGREAHIWPGQDYANERVMEWHTLSKPGEDLFARDKFPRMPWHDVGLQLVGQPARDLCRHFIQRWNYLLRIKNHSRQMPFLIPPPDFTPAELKQYGLTGSCEVQICRSAGPWSMGTASKVEHSIQNAYLKSIQMSDHFVYIENQFFVTSTVVEGNKIENQIGEALVSRIIRAHREGTPWRAIIVIPLIPGFPMPIDHPDASSVRLIVELQNRSISRGEHSIFGKLRREGIDPEQYISFFSLRTWGRLRGGRLTTEQIYLHDKIMIVDDRLAIIGSANINERSQRGDRDSELACVIRDHDMLDSTMGGKPYKVGKFAHTMRLRLMREHLGVDVDKLEAKERRRTGKGTGGQTDESDDSDESDESDGEWDPDNEQTEGGLRKTEDGEPPHKLVEVQSTRRNMKEGVSNLSSRMQSGTSTGMKRQIKDTLHQESEKMKSKKEENMSRGEAEEVTDANEKYQAAREDRVNQTMRGEETNKFPDGKYDSAMEPTLEERMMVDDSKAVNGHERSDHSIKKSASSHRRASSDGGRLAPSALSSSLGPERESQMLRHSTSRDGSLSGHDDDPRSKLSSRMSTNLWKLPAAGLEIDPFRFSDPLDDSFYKDYWLTCAVHNTQIFRKVFKSVPDDTVTTWAEYKAFGAWADRLARSGAFSAKESRDQRDAQAHSVPEASVGGPVGQLPTHSHGSEKGDKKQKANDESQIPSALRDPASGQGPNGASSAPKGGSQAEGFTQHELSQMEALLEECKGSLVLHPTRFLEAEDQSNNFLFAMDRINPLLIYD